MPEPATHLPRQRWAPWLALVLLSLLFWGAAARMHVTVDGVRYHFLDDDQMISMRYARNLADGLGPVWNAGERVEGYTNFGWMLVMAAVHAGGAGDATAALWVQTINWLLACATVLFAGRLLVALGGGRLAWAVLVPLALATDLLFWAVNGFETTLLTALFLWCMLRVLRDTGRGVPVPWSTFVLAGLLPAVRADALDLTAGVILAALALDGRRSRVRWLGAVVPILAHEAFRVSYYGDWLPNTFYLKVSGRSALWLGGLGYVKGFAAAYVAALILAFAAGLWGRSRALRVLAVLPLAGVARVLYTGPDIFDFHRFLAPYVPLVLVVAGTGIEEIAAGAAEARRTMAVLLAFATIAWSGVEGRTRFAALRSVNGDPSTTTVAGVLIARHTLPQASVAVLAAGAIGYFSRRPAIDLLGKSDRHVARLPVHPKNPTGHNRFDFEWSLARRPDIVSIFSSHAHVARAAAEATRPSYDREREGWGSTLVLSRSFTEWYRDQPVPLPYLLERCALYVRADSPEAARLSGWREPRVEWP